MTGPVIFLLTLAAKGGVLLLIAFVAAYALGGAHALGGVHAFGGAPAELRRRVWLTTLLGLLLLPLLTATLPGWQVLPFPVIPGERAPGNASALAAGVEGQPPGGDALAAPFASPRLEGIPHELGVIPHELGVIPHELGVIPHELEGTPVGLEGIPHGLGGVASEASGADAGSPLSEGGIGPAGALLLGGWIVGGGLVLLRAGWGILALGRVRRRGRRIGDPSLLRALDTAARHAGVDPGRIELLVSDELGVPATWGVRRPMVVLPSRIARAPGRLRDTVLLHELLHVRRQAWLGQLLALAACAVHWFNPLAWRARRELIRVEEEAVDEAVVRSGLSPELYGEHLVAVARTLRTARPGRAVAVAMAGERALQRRLEALFRANRLSPPPTPVVTWTVTATLLLGIVGTASLEARPSDPSDPQEPVAISQEPVAISQEPVAISPDPILELGVAEGLPEEEFHRVGTPFHLPGDRLAVPVGGALEIRVFAPDGTFLEGLGRSGEGPGEFRALSEAWARGDTIEVMDGQLRRITRFLPDGTVETVPLAEAPGVQGSVPEPLSDGWITTGVAAASMDDRDEIVIHRFAEDGTHLAEIARMPGMERVQYPSGGSGPAALSPRAQVEVRGDRIYVAETLTPEIRVFHRDGTLERSITWEPDPGPGPADALAEVRGRAEAMLDEGRPGVVEPALALSAPDRISPFWSFLVDAEGYLWIRDYEPAQHAMALGGSGGGSYLRGGAGPGGEWRVLDPEGTEVGWIRIPEGLEPLRVDSEVVLGLHRDPLGVESVRGHELERR